MSKTFCIAALIALCSTGCARSEVARNLSSNVPAPRASAESRPSVVVREEGWRIPGLDGSRAVERIEVKGASDGGAKMYVTKYAPNTPGAFIIGESFFSAEERTALRAFSGELVVTSLWGYDVNGRAFSYLALVHPPGVGALNRLRFYDEDGDGKFESAEHTSGGVVPALPRWAQ